ncbi:hypothetical protein O3G_MSEX010822 [Manduca sexta]|uniref:RNA-directed DNA polymerase n=1 Tax=Manduca sexta TaxID=7130 RepID=A0A922CUF8_MANSE|nr:hypothetical protein O3G_MSEX010822 [Manduca sexta]
MESGQKTPDMAKNCCDSRSSKRKYQERDNETSDMDRRKEKRKRTRDSSGSEIMARMSSARRSRTNVSERHDSRCRRRHRSSSSSTRHREEHRRHRTRDSSPRRRSRRSEARASSGSRTTRQRPSSPVRRSNNSTDNMTYLLLTELMNSFVNNSRHEGNKFPLLGNVIPDFDPMVKGQTIQMWLNKVDECAKLYKWGDDQIIHYALPKLVGVAKTWYQTLPTMSFSWLEWKNKLTESFPCSEDYAEMLTEMLSKRVKYNDLLELYYYEKIRLLNRCDIKGTRAVDCLLYGIEDRSLRLGAKALNCQEPEQVLKYFQSTRQQLRDIDKPRFNDKKISTLSSSSNVKSVNNDTKVKGASGAIVCYNCNEPGHFSFRCTKRILKCNICNRLGHTTINCTKLPSDISKGGKTNEKDILRVDTENVVGNNDKYTMQVKLNGHSILGFVDLGSQCTLIRYSDAKDLGISWSDSNLPTMRGIGSNIVLPLGCATVVVQIQNILEKIEALIVEDNVIKYPILIEHSFTEKPGIVITKTYDSLIFTRETRERFYLTSVSNVSIQPKQMCLVRTVCPIDFCGTVYVRGSLRGKPGYEYYLMPGEYEIVGGQGILVIQNLSDNVIVITADSLITRALSSNNCMDINVLCVDDDQYCTELNYDPNLSFAELNQLKELLIRYKECFSTNLKDLGFTNIVKMEIELTDNKPVVYRPYRLSYSERQLVRSMVEDMIEADIVCESNSQYASPILLVKKKTGEKRLCVDYRALNAKTRKEHYPLPLIDDQLDMLAGNSLFISLDCASGYYQIPIADSSQEKTAFVMPDGQYQFKRMPFGLANVPSIFQRTMNKILSRSKVDYAIIFMDDILIPARSFGQGLERLEKVLQLLSEAGLTLKLKKCNFFYKEIDFLGFQVSGEGIRPGSHKILAVSNFPVPRNVHDVRRFIGLASFFRRFIKDFALIARPLTDLLKSNFIWKWNDEHFSAFNTLKQKLAERPILALYDVKLETELHTDASKLGVAGILMQRHCDGSLRPVAYYSRKTNVDEQKLHSFELETLAVIASLKRFRVYLLGLKFKIITDCNALRTTLTKRDLIPRISRWWVQFQEFDCEIVYRAGTRMLHVDALSRAPVTEPVADDDETHFLDVLNINTEDWISTVQSNDDEINRIRDILRDKNTSIISDIYKNYQLRGNNVFRIVGDKQKWVVPRAVRWQILRMNHDEVGHFGYEKTLNRIREIFWFPKMRRFLKKYVSACLQCAHHKAPSGCKEGMLHPIPKIDTPFHTLHADYLGPFVRSKRGNTYILAIIDSFTKFINIKAVRDTKSTTAIRVFKEYFSNFGTPSRLITDQGTYFTSAKFKSFITSSNIKHILNAVATPRANGQIERYNRTILDALSTKCHGKGDNIWDEYVGDIQLGMNTTMNKATGKSPSELLFGFKVLNSSENMINEVLNEIITRVTDDDLAEVRSAAKLRIEKQQQYSKKLFDKRRKNVTSYNIGDLVRVERTIIDKEHIGKSKKLIAKFHGPYCIIKILDNDRFLIEDTPLSRRGNKKYQNVVSVDKIHPWLSYKDMTSESSENDNSGDEILECNENDK